MKYRNIYNYSHYTSYRMNTTIQISNETKELIGTFGKKEDTYEDIIKRMYEMAVKEQLREFLMSSKNTISIDEAIKRVNKQWPK
jgi:predicted CopG family antitoxin